MQRNKQSQKRQTLSFHGSQKTHFPTNGKKSENHDLIIPTNGRKPHIPGIDTTAKAFHHSIYKLGHTLREKSNIHLN